MAERTCSEDACSSAAHRRGLCTLHYSRAYQATVRLREATQPGLAETRLARKSEHQLNRPPCSVTTCSKPSLARTYCAGHWKRWSLTGDVDSATPLRKRRPAGHGAVRDDQGRKLCSHCSRWLPESAFMANTRAPDGRQNYCSRCAKNAMLKRQFGLTIEKFEEMRDRQGGACAICRQEHKRLVVDHDHGCCPGEFSCGACIRGLLCGNCNTALGLLRDDRRIFEAAIRYIGVAREA